MDELLVSEEEIETPILPVIGHNRVDVEEDMAVISVGDPNLIKDLLATLGELYDQLSECGHKQLYDTNHKPDSDPHQPLHISDDTAVLKCLIETYSQYESKINQVIPEQLLKDAERFVAVIPQMSKKSYLMSAEKKVESHQKKMTYIWGQCGTGVKQTIRNILMSEIKKRDQDLLVEIEKYMKHMADHLPLRFEMMLLDRIYQKYQTQKKAFVQCEKILNNLRDRRRRYVMAFAELAHDDVVTECLPAINSCRTSVNDALATRITNLENRTGDLKSALTSYQKYLKNDNSNGVLEPARPYICNICSTNQISHVTQCGHFMCEPCMNSIAENNYDRRQRNIIGSNCPYCQARIQSTIRVYFVCHRWHNKV